MSNTRKAFENGTALLAYFICGDPDLETSEKLIFAMERAGVNLILLGIPFSDPTAEGHEIMAANGRALAAGVTTEDVFALVERVRQKTDIPLAFAAYANIVFSRGVENFISRMSSLHIDALFLPDVPYEEKGEFDRTCRQYGIDLISVVAPTAGGRAIEIMKDAKGFLYCVSALDHAGGVGELIATVKRTCDIPCVVHATPEEVRSHSLDVDGVIVDTEIVGLIKKYGKASVPHVEAFLRELK